MSNKNPFKSAHKKTQYFVPIDWVEPTNPDIDQVVVDKIAEKIDWEIFGALPGRFSDDSRFVITDGNHRLAALKKMGEKYVPVILLTHREFTSIAFDKKHIQFLVFRTNYLLNSPVNI